MAEFKEDGAVITIGPYSITDAPYGKKEIWLTADPSKKVRMLSYQLHHFLKKARADIAAGKTPRLPDVR